MKDALKRLALSVAIAVSLGGCAATVNTASSGPPGGSTTAATVQPAASKTVALLLKGANGIEAGSSWQSLADEWHYSMMAAADARGLRYISLRPGQPDPEEPAAIVVVTVNDFRYQSQVMRFMVGILAGNAYMDLDVQYWQGPNRQLLGSKKINTSSSAWGGVFSAATPKQVVAVVGAILDDVQGKGAP